MKTLETNLDRSSHPNSLMPLTWYLISTSHIPPSLVLFYCPEHAITFIPCLCAFPIGILSQIRYSLIVILKLNGSSEVQYKDMMIVDDGKYQ